MHGRSALTSFCWVKVRDRQYAGSMSHANRRAWNCATTVVGHWGIAAGNSETGNICHKTAGVDHCHYCIAILKINAYTDTTGWWVPRATQVPKGLIRPLGCRLGTRDVTQTPSLKTAYYWAFDSTHLTLQKSVECSLTSGTWAEFPLLNQGLCYNTSHIQQIAIRFLVHLAIA